MIFLLKSDLFQKAISILCKEARLLEKDSDVLKYSLKGIVSQGCSELCLELGHYFFAKEEWAEAIIWYYNAAYETSGQMSLKAGTTEPLSKLISCYEALGMQEMAREYKKQLEKMMQEDISQ